MVLHLLVRRVAFVASWPGKQCDLATLVQRGQTKTWQLRYERRIDHTRRFERKITQICNFDCRIVHIRGIDRRIDHIRRIDLRIWPNLAANQH